MSNKTYCVDYDWYCQKIGASRRAEVMQPVCDQRVEFFHSQSLQGEESFSVLPAGSCRIVIMTHIMALRVFQAKKFDIDGVHHQSLKPEVG